MNRNYIFKYEDDFNKLKVITKSREESVLLGATIGGFLKKGDVLCLDGDLGAGKTALTSGIANGMGMIANISSPTFTILMEHKKSDVIPLFHFDAYRLLSEDDFYDLGFDEYLSNEGVCIIEWAKRIKLAIPQNAIWIDLIKTSLDLTDERLIIFNFPKTDDRFLNFKNNIISSGLFIES